jgi:hypothetical protein
MTGGEVVLLGMTMGELAIAGGSLVSAVGQLQAGANAQKAANYNAQVAYNNAHSSRLAAAEDAKRQDRAGRKRQGSNRAVDPDKLDLLEDSALEEALGVASVLHAGEVKAVGFESNARLEIAKGKSAKDSAVFGAATTALMGVAGPALDGMNLMGSTAGAGITTAQNSAMTAFHPFKGTAPQILF